MWREAPRTLNSDLFRLEPLGPQHNEMDHRAWMSSIDRIRSTPGFSSQNWGGDSWPHEMTLEENLADLVDHAGEFERGEAFAYSVIDPVDGEVIGCVYVDPDEVAEARCRFWVTADKAGLDSDLERALRAWFAGPEWQLTSIRFPGRD
jgi:hypothetical protein